MKPSAIILAGGESSRFGSDKSLLVVDGSLLIERTIARWNELFDDIIIVSDRKNKFSVPNAREVVDIYKNRGPLGGVHAGLFAAFNEWSFVIACDMPCVEAGFIKELIASADGAAARIILPVHDGIVEPLCAMYHADCLAAAEKMLADGENCVLDLYGKFPVKYIAAENCFYNINFPEDLAGFGKDKANRSRRYKNRLLRLCSEKGLCKR